MLSREAATPAVTLPRARVSAAAVARAAGVSSATVSYVMNGRQGVSADTRRRILTVANELGYRPTGHGKLPDPQLTRVIALVLPNIVNPMYTEWAQHIISEAARDGFEVFVATTLDDADTFTQVARAVAARNVDGAIVASALRNDSRALRALRQNRIPFVCLSRHSEHVPGDFVGIDDDAAAAELMQHAIDHGYTEIATVIGPRSSTASLAREFAFVRTAAAAGIVVAGARKISTRLSSEGGLIAAQRLLRSSHRPRAIVCGSDEIAIGIMEHALALGLRIPEDLAVLSNDGVPHSLSPLIGLTTIVQPIRQMAEQAFELLQDQIASPRTAYRHVVCGHQLHIGTTCGCTPASNPESH